MDVQHDVESFTGACARRAVQCPDSLPVHVSDDGGQFAAYDPAAPPPANLATTTTDEGITVPYIVRIERGTMNRGLHEIAVLFDPAQPWTAWAPQPQWNQKLVMQYGAGTSQQWRQGTTESVLNHEALSRGFMVAGSTMLVNGQHSNFVTAAETTMMLKEHIIENYGLDTLHDRSGRLGRRVAAASYRRQLSGIAAGLASDQQDWEDSISGAYREFADSGALVHAFTNVLPYLHRRRIARRSAVGVRPIPTCSTSRPGRLPDYNQPNDGTNCAGADSYNATTNPTGVRCTFQDFMVSIYGRRPQDDYANLVCDNVGVQYGLLRCNPGSAHAGQVRRRERAGPADST